MVLRVYLPFYTSPFLQFVKCVEDFMGISTALHHYSSTVQLSVTPVDWAGLGTIQSFGYILQSIEFST